ncbi:hypothetical protein E2C01_102541 [Portunus trituberculatus]|uniref:Uncharacterized protein n=1 Tax=Portunus trituberculatus TaxID=210409 RepID=A0A5B7KIQ0_PORTR|nr:hypothetical protein [Portunus trituberculatus]
MTRLRTPRWRCPILVPCALRIQ